MKDILEVTEKILEYGPICDHCLGRMYGKSSHGLLNTQRGSAMRIALALEKNVPYEKEEDTCWICGNLFDKTESWAEKIKTAIEPYEHETILVGCRVPPLMSESEEMIWTDLSLTNPEPLKAEFNRETGKAVSALTKSQVDFKRPDIVIICNLSTEEVEVEVNSLYIYGRYMKYERGIPQTRWFCRECKGKGCERCNFTGKMYQDSVEELIGRPIIKACEASDAILHGAGREDIDARMIGTGRPFVLEIVKPRKRSVPLNELEALVNKSAENRVSVTFDHVSDRHEVETLKSGKAHKKYSILVKVEGDFSVNEINSALNGLKGVTINQRTPDRVSHRRADLIRKRQCLDIECSGMEDGIFRITVLGDAGLYIKELISGDNDRTKPSLSEILGCPAQVTSLDVIMVEGVVPENRNEMES
ncbi:tRNA pseudouridine synthase 10 [Methanomicrobium sp. W14]|uniref:tRNA pseudouridine(54/55) synthase Pus10 n=1 Tax=Methanomicrobium sp. W14 TaxID=2817839 RepID=UPI001AE82A4F|nr:tRNA pseudouridine(54/55) synthase Pus10 [Methanomicrobium sp. W14]MBP2132869.1 tRNA pseudouridine synthase 10 [Methanomicrobium sp. W14]